MVRFARATVVVLFVLALAPAAFAARQAEPTPTAPEPGAASPTAAATATATPSAPRDPLAARLGGDRAAFERVYGDPVSETLAEVYPFGVEYRPPGFGAVDVFFHKGLVLFVRLSADLAAGDGGRPAPGAWTAAEADELLRRFLPADLVLDGEPVPAGDGRRVGGGHSRALEPTFGRATYQQYGAIGDRGDVHFVLALDGEERVTAIELKLGAALAAATGLTPDEQTYVAAVEQRVRPFAESVGRVGALYAEPHPDPAWRSAVRAELVYWRLTHDAVRRLTPPADLAAIHASYVAALALYDSAADDLEASLATADGDRIERAALKMRSGGERLATAAQDLADLKRRRSG